jgi:ST7 protein
MFQLIGLVILNFSGKPEYELMQTAWRERNPEARIKAAKDAIVLNPECATAYILLAEEEATDIAEAEVKFREAYRIAETNHRRSQQLQHQVVTRVNICKTSYKLHRIIIFRGAFSSECSCLFK